METGGEGWRMDVWLEHWYNSLAEPQRENKVTRFRIVAKVVHSPWDLAGSGGDRVRVRRSFGLRRWPFPAKRCRGGSIRR